nr:MAG TPA: hypothetical protein [Caudoviricetes sp.]
MELFCSCTNVSSPASYHLFGKTFLFVFLQ